MHKVSKQHLELLMLKRDACVEELKENIQDKSREKDQDKTFEECGSFIKRIIE